MIILLSPAKSLDFDRSIKSQDFTQPAFLSESLPLINNLKRKSIKSIKGLMSISDNLAMVNKKRYEAFHTPFTIDNAKQAISLFAGDVYLGLDAATLSKQELSFAQDHLRILSGLYGLLKPLDLIQAYRLEMGTSLAIRRKKNLYQYWGDKITDEINNDLKENDFVVNLASNEYAKAVNFKNIAAPVYQVNFKEYKDTKLTFVSFNAKRARGLMSRWLIQNEVSDPKDLYNFDLDRYKIDPKHSLGNELVFTRSFRKAGS